MDPGNNFIPTELEVERLKILTALMIIVSVSLVPRLSGGGGGGGGGGASEEEWNGEPGTD